ncbi:MAG TPA: SH3 domain-containing protein [Anaerolineales bacterium]|nr:SH3 domain-containing protein [Anaerolineales bacterium]
MRLFPTLSLLCLFPIVLAACAPAESTASPDGLKTVVAATFAAMTESAPTSAPEATFTAIASPAPENTPEPASFFALTNAQNVNLRVGPGSLFKVSRVMAQNESLQVLGRARGGEWLYVLNDEGIKGWVAALFVNFAHDGPPPPFVEPDNAAMITGTVHTELGTPVSGIGFAFEQGKNRADAETDKEGRFYVYLPSNLSGAWEVRYVSINCQSNTMDANCNCISGACGSAFPPKLDVTLPSLSDLVFVWK